LLESVPHRLTRAEHPAHTRKPMPRSRHRGSASSRRMPAKRRRRRP
jgi:hypothetical protein